MLLDAGIRLLARQGARGLTYRALDAEAAVPAGTSSNYFRSREVLLGDVGRRVYERLTPSPEQLAADSHARPSRKRLVELMQALLRRVEAERESWIALLELRLEATRYPMLEALVRDISHADFTFNLDFHRKAKLPGGEREIALLIVAMNGLVLERLTMRDVVPLGDLDGFVKTLVERLVPTGRTKR